MIPWLATALALGGQVLMIFKSPLAFILWSMGEGILLVYSVRGKRWAEVTFFTLYITTNLTALLVWQYS
jgi:4-hydroxybenzoate polyprenyltransferase